SFDHLPVWSPDGKLIAFDSSRRGAEDIYQKRVSGGQEEPLLLTSAAESPTDWSRDGRLLVYQRRDDATGHDIWTLSPASGETRPFLKTQFNELGGQLSPDQRLMAYVSDESRRLEVYVAA